MPVAAKIAVVVVLAMCAAMASASSITLADERVQATMQLSLDDMAVGDVVVEPPVTSAVDRSVLFRLSTEYGPQVDLMFRFGDGKYEQSWGVHTIEVAYTNTDGIHRRAFGIFSAKDASSDIYAADGRPYDCGKQVIELNLYLTDSTTPIEPVSSSSSSSSSSSTTGATPPDHGSGDSNGLADTPIGRLVFEGAVFYGSWTKDKSTHTSCPNKEGGEPCHMATVSPGVVGCTTAPPSTSGSSGGGDAGKKKKEEGSAFGGVLVLFFLIFSLYCCIGIGYKKFVVKAEGIDQLPNPDFWVGLGTACSNLGNACRNGCRRSPSGYSAASLEPPEYDF